MQILRFLLFFFTKNDGYGIFFLFFIQKRERGKPKSKLKKLNLDAIN